MTSTNIIHPPESNLLIRRFTATEAFAVCRLPKFHIHGTLPSINTASVAVITMGQRNDTFPKERLTAAHTFLYGYKYKRMSCYQHSCSSIKNDWWACLWLPWGIRKDGRRMAGLGTHKILHTWLHRRLLHKSVKEYHLQNTPLCNQCKYC